jgi:protein arginine kinase
MKGKLTLPSSLYSDALPTWFTNSGPESDLVISSRIRLARNLLNHRFTYHAGRSERKKVFECIAEVLQSHKEFSTFSLINCSNLSRLDQQLLLEERLISPDLLTIEGDRGVAIENTKHTSLMINEEDHLRLHSIDSGFKAEEVWYRINLLDDLLGQYLPYAYDPRRGFLTSCPTNSGTGLRVSFLLHLPGLYLTKTIDSVLLGASQMGISTRGFFGEHSEVVGNLFQLSNQATLGACEDDFLQHTRKIILEVITHERTARERILNDARNEITDKVFRAWGILLYAKMLTISEFLNLTSALRFGINAGIFKEITIDQLNRMTLVIMPAHMQLFRQKTIPEDRYDFERAEVLQNFISLEKKVEKPRKQSTKVVKSEKTVS